MCCPSLGSRADQVLDALDVDARAEPLSLVRSGRRRGTFCFFFIALFFSFRALEPPSLDVRCPQPGRGTFFFFFLELSSRRRLTFGLRSLGDEAPVLSTTSPQLGRPARDGRFGLRVFEAPEMICLR